MVRYQSFPASYAALIFKVSFQGELRGNEPYVLSSVEWFSVELPRSQINVRVSSDGALFPVSTPSVPLPVLSPDFLFTSLSFSDKTLSK